MPWKRDRSEWNEVLEDGNRKEPRVQFEEKNVREQNKDYKIGKNNYIYWSGMVGKVFDVHPEDLGVDPQHPHLSRYGSACM